MSTTTALKRREFLQLAKTYDPSKPPKTGIGGWYVSEKLDGQRCFWDGGITRGMNTDTVPWASITDPKTGGRKKKIRPLATGLWSRYGNPIMAPDWFLNGLPACPLDGELFGGRGQFQTTMSAVRKDNPIESEWEGIQFAVYSSPAFESIFGDGEIKNSNFHCAIKWAEISKFIRTRQTATCVGNDMLSVSGVSSFNSELQFLVGALESQTDFAYLHQQILLPTDEGAAADAVERHLEGVLDKGGEGIILRSGESIWTPKRVSHILKYKLCDDAEAVITGFTSGREGKEGLLRGKIGAIITEYDGKRLEIAGLTHEERTFWSDEQSQYAYDNPGVDMPIQFQGKHFKVGQTICFKYTDLSDDGIPKIARYFRKV